jgi:very-short-patch-repair endonuclease
MSEARHSISDRVEASRKDLLDLGLRNPLLNYRPTRGRGLEVVDELPEEVFRILVREGKTMSFDATPEKEDHGSTQISGEGFETEVKSADGEEAEAGDWPEPAAGSFGQPGEASDGTAARHTDRRLQTALNSESLQKRLLATERYARASMEEQGVNLLFLAMGMLRWVEAESSQEIRRAPLLLVPVSLDRSDAQQRFQLEYTGEELDQNLSLEAKLRQEFGLRLPELPDQEELDIEEYFDSVERVITDQKQWSVDRQAIFLGFFSFSKFLMYRDLDDERWPEGEKLSDHDVIRGLLGEERPEEPERLSEDDNVDLHLKPEDTRHVLDADSSQTLALMDVDGGSNLIVQGPPGTGKSQTITNVIAEAVGRGDSVLFVSEKMAALEVVKRRLDQVGLGDACLELHSRKTKKKAVLDELAHTMALGRPQVARTEDDVQVLSEMRDQLNAYCVAVNAEILESGFTPYYAMGELLLQSRDVFQTPRLGYEKMRGWSRGEFRRQELLVEQLQAKLSQIGVPKENPFYGTHRTVLMPTDLPDLEQKLSLAEESAKRLREASEVLADHLGIRRPEDREGAEAACRVAERVSSAPDLAEMNLRSEAWNERRSELEELVEVGATRERLLEEYEGILSPEAWEMDIRETRETIAAYADRWWRPISGKYRSARRDLSEICFQELPKDAESQLAMVDAILEVQRSEKTLEEQGEFGLETFGARWLSKDSEWQLLREAVTYMSVLHREIKQGELTEAILDYLAGRRDDAGSAEKLAEVEAALVEHATSVEDAEEKLNFADDEEETAVSRRLLSEQESNFRNLRENLHRLQDIVSYNQLVERLEKEGLDEVLRISENWAEAGSKLAQAFRYTWFEGLLEDAFRERPALSAFDREGHEHTSSRFRELDALLVEHNRSRLALEHWRAVPNHGGGGQLGLLHREIQKKRRHLPIRRLLWEAGDAVQAIKPIFMMSPLSVANFLEPGGMRFDLIVFDEASQVRPVEALGAIARGRQVVVVGDSKQLPPTTFFDTLAGDEEDDENLTGDLESVLGLFVSGGYPQRMLRWHYRSRHESLITVSNAEFYDNRLTVFPSPERDREDLGLSFLHLPHTTYDRGRSQSNPGEAEAVARAVMDHARNRPERTLGVAAFSSSQAQAIQDQIEILRRQDSSREGFFKAHSQEPFFVKNLENVQGDERDTIFISVGYGKDSQGRTNMNFGPLNRDGGERRLNVLITRARRACTVFTNLTSEDIDLGRSSARGVRALKTFLRYAQHGDLEVPTATGEVDSPFEEAVLFRLQELGYRVDSQVGSAGFRIDLAVVDPERPGSYLLGIECDGATYHSARAARDRDRLRQEVLEGLGWRIHRVWSTDWFRNQDSEIARLVEAVEKARVPVVESAPEPEPIPDPLTDADEREEVVIREPGASSGSHAEDLPSYEVAEFERLLPTEVHEVSISLLAEYVEKIVLVESPVHIEDLTRRIADAALLSRAGSRVRRAVGYACEKAHKTGKIAQSGDFLWEPGRSEARARDRSGLPDAARKYERIAPEEMQVAVLKLVNASFGIESNEVPPAILRMLLGFRRTSGAAYYHILEIVEGMVAQGQLQERDGHLKVAD